VSGVVAAWQGRPVQGWLAYGIGIGLGILTKGPVVLVHVLPVAALAPWWARTPRPTWSSWYAGLLGALVLGAGIGLSWALPAASRGGPAYETAILWKQTAGRVVNAFAHRRPWWWYLPLLPVVLFPWSVWPPLWRSLISRRIALDQPSRFALAWLVPGLVLLSVISGKQVHYLLPLLPAFVILAAARLGRESGGSRYDMAPVSSLLAAIGVALLFGWTTGKPSWAPELSPGLGILLVLGALVLLRIRGHERQAFALALVSPVLVLGLHFAGTDLLRRYDLAPAARYLKGVEESGHPIAYLGRYQGEFHFLGRLQQPIAELKPDGIEAWARSNSGGLLVQQGRRASNFPGAIRRWPYRDGYITMRAAASLVPSQR
jgi:4-amino-4-deoxy-L-arabinose transferase-like glycosyltransferase